MKRRVDKLSYDTDKATLVGSAEFGSRIEDTDWSEETLYQKRTGEFFLHGTGGQRSRYAKLTRRSGWATEGEIIIPLDLSAAKDWAESNLDADVVDRYFGEAPERGPWRITTINLTEAAFAKLESEASARGKSKSSLVEELILAL